MARQSGGCGGCLTGVLALTGVAVIAQLVGPIAAIIILIHLAVLFAAMNGIDGKSVNVRQHRRRPPRR